jgi:hypothetical protein
MAKRTRIAQGLAALALAAGAVLALSAPAQADIPDCVEYVEARTPWPVGDEVWMACGDAAAWDGHSWCVAGLLDLGVRPDVAEEACSEV